ncbi:hypothetical protein D3C81_1399280 [compost metagenome]
MAAPRHPYTHVRRTAGSAMRSCRDTFVVTASAGTSAADRPNTTISARAPAICATSRFRTCTSAFPRDQSSTSGANVRMPMKSPTTRRTMPVNSGKSGGVGQRKFARRRLISVTDTAANAAIDMSQAFFTAEITLRWRWTIVMTTGIWNAEPRMTQVNPYRSIIGTRIWAK